MNDLRFALRQLLKNPGFTAVAVLTLALAFGPSEFIHAQERMEANPQSPRLRRLAEELRAGKRDAVEAFWKEIDGKAPLIEPIPGDDDFRWITFVVQTNAAELDVVVLGDIPTRDSKHTFRRLVDTDVWFKTDRIPKDARFGYGFGIDGGRFKPDPLNPRQFAGRSVAELPDAPPQPWIVERPEVPKGSLTALSFTSKLLNEERGIAVYTPPGYNTNAAPCGLLIVFDGESYGSREHSAIQTPTILNNLLAAKKVPPLIAVLVNSQKTRDRDLVCSAPFSDFLAHELVPWVQTNYHVSKDASRGVLAGSSYGGLCAAYTAWKHPKVFGNVLSQSGSFRYFPGPKQDAVAYTEETGWLTRQFVKAPRAQTRFYLEVGKLEGPLIAPHRHLRDVLEAKGYAVTYTEFTGGHDYLTWRNSLGDGLIAIIGKGELTTDN